MTATHDDADHADAGDAADAADAAEAGTEAPRRIQSLDVGFRLVRAVEEASAPLTLKEVSALAGMPRSKAHLYLSTFIGLGLIARDYSGRYTLGPYALQLGLAALRKTSVADVADPAMQSLQRATGHSVHLAVWGNQGPTIVKKIDGNQHVPVSVRVGFVMPLLTTATGRLFVAYHSQAVTRPLLEKERLRSPEDARKLDAIVEAIRADGYASSDSGLHEGFAALSAPIFDHAGELCAAIAVVDAGARLPPGKRPETALLLKQAAGAISGLLGYSPPSP